MAEYTVHEIPDRISVFWHVFQDSRVIASCTHEADAERIAEALRAQPAPVPSWELVTALEQVISDAKTGFQNILEFRKLSNGRYGALTREEVEGALKSLDAALLEISRAKGGK